MAGLRLSPCFWIGTTAQYNLTPSFMTRGYYLAYPNYGRVERRERGQRFRAGDFFHLEGTKVPMVKGTCEVGEGLVVFSRGEFRDPHPPGQ